MPKQTIPTVESGHDNRNVWRVRQDDLTAYIDAAYAKTAERIASGHSRKATPPIPEPPALYGEGRHL